MLRYIVFIICTILQLLSPKIGEKIASYRVYGESPELYFKALEYSNAIQHILLCLMLLLGITFMIDYYKKISTTLK